MRLSNSQALPVIVRLAASARAPARLGLLSLVEAFGEDGTGQSSNLWRVLCAHNRRHGLLDARLRGHDEWRGYDSVFSRRLSPELCITITHRKYRGRREGRVTAAPGALAPEKLREGRVTTGTGGDTPAFPAQWFTAYFALSSVNQRLPPSFSRIILRENLAPAWARQDHTTSPSAWRRSSVGAFASTAARLTFVTIAIRPSASRRDARTIRLIWVSGKQKYFCARELTGFRACGPSGKSACLSHVLTPKAN